MTLLIVMAWVSEEGKNFVLAALEELSKVKYTSLFEPLICLLKAEIDIAVTFLTFVNSIINATAELKDRLKYRLALEQVGFADKARFLRLQCNFHKEEIYRSAEIQLNVFFKELKEDSRAATQNEVYIFSLHCSI